MVIPCHIVERENNGKTAMRYPDTNICVAAMELARDHSPAYLFNHVMRSYGFGQAAGAMQNAAYDPEVLFIGSVLHDLGLIDKFVREDRFEIDGADAAAEFLSQQGYPDKKIALIWDAIALHTTLAVPQRKEPEIALVQLGAGIDIGAVPRALVSAEVVEMILAEYPRLGFKQAFLDAMAAVIQRKPHTGTFNLMSDVARERACCSTPSFCEVVHQAEFDE